MSTADGKVAVEAVQQTPDGPNIDIAITPSGGTATEQTAIGFTHEQELFRLKWGWENYDLALRATKEASRTSNP